MLVLRSVRRRWWLLAIVAVAALVFLNREALLAGVAAAFSEERPELLDDAEPGRPGSTRKFAQRFAVGVPELELIGWLHSNHFEIDRLGFTASRRVQKVPCSELILVTWERTPGGRLSRASAEISEAGCL